MPEPLPTTAKEPAKAYLLAVDAGASKTLAVVTDTEGAVLGRGRGGGGNWQGPGVDVARREVARSVAAALAASGVPAERIDAAYFGMAGADRSADFAVVERVLDGVAPCANWAFENDATIALRAGAPDGVGIAAICGTGTNVVGFGERGEKVQIGGFGYPFGDGAGAAHIGLLAMRRAWRGMDGRGPTTSLKGRIEAHLGIGDLADVLDAHYAGRPLDWGALAPLVFGAADTGDDVARSILRDVGEELGVSACAAWRALEFGAEGALPVVAAGSVFQRPRSPWLIDAFTQRVRRDHPNARIVRLDVAPVLGAVFAALELSGRRATPERVEAYRCAWLELDPLATVAATP